MTRAHNEVALAQSIDNARCGGDSLHAVMTQDEAEGLYLRCCELLNERKVVFVAAWPQLEIRILQDAKGRILFFRAGNIPVGIGHVQVVVVDVDGRP